MELEIKNLSDLGDNEWKLFEAPYSTPWQFEIFDVNEARTWMKSNAYISLIASICYIVFIFLGQLHMRHRAPYKLRGPLALWNICLGTFSLVGFIRIIPEFFSVVTAPGGFYRSLCVRDEHNVATAFWARAFVLSKLLEFGDTIFIVLRKQKLIFLHWFHHITVCLCTWYFYYDYEPIFRYYGVCNYFVHLWMYYYYFLKAIKVPVPRSVSMLITILQLSQFVIGIFVNVYSFKLYYDGVKCARNPDRFPLHISMYTSYLILFSHYFYKAYFKRSSKVLKRD